MISGRYNWGMDIRELGFDEWFQKEQKNLKKSDGSPARISAVDRDSYLIRNDTSEIRAELAGNFLYNIDSDMDMPCVGDWVNVQYFDNGTFAVIYELYPRKSFLHRKAAGKSKDSQAIAANIDTAFIVQSCDANFNIHRLERYIVMALDGRVNPVLLLSKKDLVTPDELSRMIESVQNAGILCTILPISSRTEEGMADLKALMETGKTYCLLGSSGVGKTTLLNRLIGQDIFETQEVREFDGKGRHTTTRRQLTVLDGGAMLVDTPGMRELGTLGMGDGIHESFVDAAELANDCRFADCTHTTEDGCALLAALSDGRLPRERYESYMKLLSEADFHELSYAEKRKKDKDFGRFIKTAKKQVRK